jgi:hypothetical protein
MKNPTEISDEEAIRAMAIGSAISDLIKSEPAFISGAALGYAWAQWLYDQAPDDDVQRNRLVGSTLKLVANIFEARKEAARAPGA